MDKSTAREKIYHLIYKEINGEEGMELSDDMMLIENLGFDSVRLIHLISEIEDAFEIEFSGDNMLFDHFERIGDLCDIVLDLVK